MANAIGLVVADMDRTRLGLKSKLGEIVGGRSVLENTLRRLGRV